MNDFENTKWSYHKKTNQSPSKRWGHTFTYLNGKIYIFGGKVDQDSRKFNQTFYSLDCQNYTFQRLEISNTPQLRDSHIAFVVSDILYIWGGCVNQQVSLDQSHILVCVSNECFAFDQKNWFPIVQHGKIPRPRQSHISTVLKNRYLLMYGGCQQQQIFHDFNIFDVFNKTWYSIKVLGQYPLNLQNSSMTLINDQVFLFGGQSTLVPLQISNGILTQQPRQIYHNNLFRLELTSFNFQNKYNPSAIIFHRVKSYNRPPAQRSGHSAIEYNNRYLIIIGGQTYSKINYDKAELLNDVWCFDTSSHLWKEIRPSSSHLFKKRSTFGAICNNQQIIIFGGLKSIDECTSFDQLLSLKLLDIQDQNVHNMCFICKLVYKNATLNDETLNDCIQYQHHTQIKYNKSNNRTTYKTAQLISHPFEAIRLLIESSLEFQASEIHIQFKQLAGKQMLFITDNGRIIHKPQLEWIVSNNLTLKSQNNLSFEDSNSHSYIKSIINYSQLFKYGGFKLGKGMIINHHNDKEQMVCVLTDDTTYSCSIENQKEKSNSKNGNQLNDYDMINPLLKTIGKDINVKNKKTKRVFFDLHSQDLSHIYTFIKKSNDIQISKKSHLIDSEKKENSEQSLRQYLSEIFLQPLPITVTINNKQEINFLKQKQKYQFLKCEKIPDCNLQIQTGLFLNIYYSPNQTKNEINIYKNNKIVTKSRRHQRSQYFGYVIVPSNWQLNLFQTGFQNDPEFIYDVVDYMINQHNKSRLQ